MENANNVRAFTYYKNETEQRAFLVADVDADGIFFEGKGNVVLMEWGKAPEEAIRLEMANFLKLVAAEKLKVFSPKYQ